MTSDPISTDLAPFSRIGKKSECTRQVSAELSGHPESELSAQCFQNILINLRDNLYTLHYKRSRQYLGIWNKSSRTCLRDAQPRKGILRGDVEYARNMQSRNLKTLLEPFRTIRWDVLPVSPMLSASQHGTSSTLSSISSAAVVGDEKVQLNDQTADRQEVVPKHCEEMEKSSGWCDNVPDFVLLHFTLVSDGAIPSGYLEQFIAPEQPIRAAADRADRRNAAITNFSAAQWLHRWRESQREQQSIERNALDQLVLASEVKPKRFRSRYQAKSFQGPTARQDARHPR